jgi:hypothetical protein
MFLYPNWYALLKRGKIKNKIDDNMLQNLKLIKKKKNKIKFKEAHGFNINGFQCGPNIRFSLKHIRCC